MLPISGQGPLPVGADCGSEAVPDAVFAELPQPVKAVAAIVMANKSAILFFMILLLMIVLDSRLEH